MADVNKIVPHIIKWEAGVSKKLPNEQLFELAKKQGWSDDPDDSGGATMIGMTLATFTVYCKKSSKPKPTKTDLKNIDYPTWLDILKTMFWDDWKADKIVNQSVANALVDFRWHSGDYGIMIPQKILGVVPDGIVGPITLGMVNSANQESFHYEINMKRLEFLEDIIERKPSQARFRTGWINRVNDLKFEK